MVEVEPLLFVERLMWDVLRQVAYDFHEKKSSYHIMKRLNRKFKRYLFSELQIWGYQVILLAKVSVISINGQLGFCGFVKFDGHYLRFNTGIYYADSTR